MRSRGIEPWDLDDDGRGGLDAERETHRLASEAGYEWLDKQSPRLQNRLKVISVRCPTQGCLLSEVYKLPLRRGGERYLARCMTNQAMRVEFLNWALSDDWHGPTVWYPVACRHGNGRLERAWLFDLVGLREGWHHALESVEQARAAAPAADQHGINSGVFHPPPGFWQSKDGSTDRSADPPALSHCLAATRISSAVEVARSP